MALAGARAASWARTYSNSGSSWLILCSERANDCISQVLPELEGPQNAISRGTPSVSVAIPYSRRSARRRDDDIAEGRPGLAHHQLEAPAGIQPGRVLQANLERIGVVELNGQPVIRGKRYHKPIFQTIP